MLLTRRLRRDDRGNAMIAVIGLLAVTSIITLTVTTATIQAVGYTSLSRAGIQANAAAEAGVDAMRAELIADRCPTGGALTATQGSVDPALSGPQAAAPFFTATVGYRISTEAAWTPGCPNDLATQIRIQSTGFATDAGVTASASAQDASAVEAVYTWRAGATSEAITGAAVFSYGSPGLANNLDLLSFDGNQANIIVRQGNITCTNTVNVAGDIVAAGGNITLNNSCSAGGRVWASGTVTLNSGTKVIGADVIAAGAGTSTISNTGVTIKGGVYTRGPLTSGNTCSAGTDRRVTTSDPCAEVLTRAKAQEAYYNRADVAAPAVPPWVDVAFSASEWTSRNWTVVTYTGPCRITNKNTTDTQIAAWSTYTSPTVIDMRGCSSVEVESNAGLSLTMRTDLTFIMPTTVTLGQFAVTTSGSLDRALRFITPDTVDADDAPTLTGCGVFSNQNTSTIAAPVAVMIYTPCPIVNTQQLKWRGQFYGSSVSFSQNSTVTYVPIGIPGADLGNGAGGPGGGGAVGGETTPGSPGDLVSYTDIDAPA